LGRYTPVQVGEALKWRDPVRREARPRDAATGGSDVSWIPGPQPPLLAGIDATGITTSAPDTPRISADILRFAESLRLRGEFDRAVTEYERFLAYYPVSPERATAIMGVLDCYRQTGRHLETVRFAESVVTDQGLEDARPEIRFMTAASYFRLGNYAAACQHLPPEGAVPGSDLHSRGLMILGLAHVEESRWESAVETFAKVPANSPFAASALACAERARAGGPSERKRPLVAGLLSVVPGLGYLYDGYPRTAISAFIVNALFGWAAIEAGEDDNPGETALLGVLSIGWYAGSIYGAVTSAHRANTAAREDYLTGFDLGFEF